MGPSHEGAIDHCISVLRLFRFDPWNIIDLNNMEALFVAKEEDIKRWIKEAVIESLVQIAVQHQSKATNEEHLISRKEAASRFHISTNTLTNWTAEGLPHYKNKRRVMFLYSELLEYIKNKQKVKPSF